MSISRDWPESRWIALVLGTTVVAWSGFILHNVADLPGQTLVSPESLYPTIVTVALLVLWLVPATRTAATWALLAWSVLHLVGGGILSVLPIGLFPFDPEQSVRHYAFHGVYAATQVPAGLAVHRVAAEPRRRGSIGSVSQRVSFVGGTSISRRPRATSAEQ
jgi:hypothetical protein